MPKSMPKKYRKLSENQPKIDPKMEPKSIKNDVKNNAEQLCQKSWKIKENRKRETLKIELSYHSGAYFTRIRRTPKTSTKTLINHQKSSPKS